MGFLSSSWDATFGNPASDVQAGRRTVRKHIERLLRLYEQQATKNASPSEAALALGVLVQRQIAIYPKCRPD